MVNRSIASHSTQGAGTGDFLGTIAPVSIEYSMVRWLEREGYDVTYITNIDTHEEIGRLMRGKGFLSVDHDEYWSHDMKAHIIQARDSGVGLGFFSANYAFCPIDLQPSSTGASNRTISVALDNRCTDGTTTQCASDADCATGQRCAIKTCNFACFTDASGTSQTEQALVGGMWDPGHLIDARYGGDIVVTSDALLNHWVFANTGLQVGDVLPGLVGVEWASTRDDFPSRTACSFSSIRRFRILAGQRQPPVATRWDLTSTGRKMTKLGQRVNDSSH